MVNACLGTYLILELVGKIDWPARLAFCLLTSGTKFDVARLRVAVDYSLAVQRPGLGVQSLKLGNRHQRTHQMQSLVAVLDLVSASKWICHISGTVLAGLEL